MSNDKGDNDGPVSFKQWAAEQAARQSTDVLRTYARLYGELWRDGWGVTKDLLVEFSDSVYGSRGQQDTRETGPAGLPPKRRERDPGLRAFQGLNRTLTRVLGESAGVVARGLETLATIAESAGAASQPPPANPGAPPAAPWMGTAPAAAGSPNTSSGAPSAPDGPGVPPAAPGGAWPYAQASAGPWYGQPPGAWPPPPPSYPYGFWPPPPPPQGPWMPAPDPFAPGGQPRPSSGAAAEVDRDADRPPQPSPQSGSGSKPDGQ
jgi:hypothetical protein